MTNILVIGGSGVIGSKIILHLINNNISVNFTYLANNVPFAKGHQLDISHRDSTINLIEKINPDIVIHTSAITNIDLCEQNHKYADLINVQGTRNIIDGCRKIKSKIIYFSTAYVFDYSKDQFFEDNTPNPLTYYGLTKYNSEKILRNSDLDYLILRTDQPYCWPEKWQRANSVTRVTETLNSRKTLKEITDWYNNPTYVPNLVEIMMKLIELNETGIFHAVGPDFISRYNWSLRVAKIFNLDQNLIIPINSSELNLPVKRNNVKLNNQKISKVTGLKMIGVDGGGTLMKQDNISH